MLITPPTVLIILWGGYYIKHPHPNSQTLKVTSECPLACVDSLCIIRAVFAWEKKNFFLSCGVRTISIECTYKTI